MKNISRIICTVYFLVNALISLGQAPQSFNYQAVVRDNQGKVIANQAISLRISLMQNDQAVFVETHQPTTNDFGLISVAIGKGTAVSGTLGDVIWGEGPTNLKMEIDPAGGSTYTLVSITQLLSVPYAIHAKTVEDDRVLTEAEVLQFVADNAYATKAYVDALEARLDSLLNALTPKTVQQRLDLGETPIEIYNSDHTLLDSLYGKAYQGGLIFHLNTSNGSGLVAAEQDQSNGIKWYNGTYILVGTDPSIGDGKDNTSHIVSVQGTSGTGYAALLSNNLTLNDFSDWFLPSRNELGALYINLWQQGIGGFSNEYYWSSTEFEMVFSEEKNAYCRHFGTGNEIFFDKANQYHVRAVREFSN